MNITYRYKLYDRVDTPLYTNCIITMLGYDSGGTTYYTRHQAGNDWWSEELLKHSVESTANTADIYKYTASTTSD